MSGGARGESGERRIASTESEEGRKMGGMKKKQIIMVEKLGFVCEKETQPSRGLFFFLVRPRDSCGEDAYAQDLRNLSCLSYHLHAGISH